MDSVKILVDWISEQGDAYEIDGETRGPQFSEESRS